jgi:hypothetical protein
MVQRGQVGGRRTPGAEAIPEPNGVPGGVREIDRVTQTLMHTNIHTRVEKYLGQVIDRHAG